MHKFVSTRKSHKFNGHSIYSFYRAHKFKSQLIIKFQKLNLMSTRKSVSFTLTRHIYAVNSPNKCFSFINCFADQKESRKEIEGKTANIHITVHFSFGLSSSSNHNFFLVQLIVIKYLFWEIKIQKQMEWARGHLPPFPSPLILMI